MTVKPFEETGSMNDTNTTWLRILLIEDSLYDELLFREIISETIYAASRIDVANSLEEGVNKWNHNQYDLVVSDLHLPDRKGLDTLDNAKNVFLDVPIILLTGSGGADLGRIAMRNGYQDYLMKDSLNEQILENAITYAVERYRLVRKLQDKIDDLQSSSNRMEIVARAMSHDLRSPINRIISLINLAQFDEDNLDEYLNKASKSAHKLKESFSEMMSIVSGYFREEVEPDQVSFSATLNEVTDDLANLLEESKAKLVTDFSSVENIEYPKVYLRSILLNLVSNALKYRSPDRLLRIVVRSHLTDDYVCLTVQDNGLGIDLQNHKSELFGLFQRFHKEIGVEGTGLGLYNIKQQVEKYGGSIEVDSAPGKGTLFHVYLRRVNVKKKDEPQVTAGSHHCS